MNGLRSYARRLDKAAVFRAAACAADIWRIGAGSASRATFHALHATEMAKPPRRVRRGQARLPCRGNLPPPAERCGLAQTPADADPFRQTAPAFRPPPGLGVRRSRY